jgi:3-oxoacyl-[acyl-carrier-protein] synthase-3
MAGMSRPVEVRLVPPPSKVVAAPSPPPLGTNARVGRTLVSEIVAVGYAYPSDVVDNDEYFRRCRFPISDNKPVLVRDSRMKERRWCGPDENTWTMARDAVHMAMESGQIDPGEIDLVVVSSCSTIPMVNYPNPQNPVMADLSPMVLREIGRDNAFGMDVKGTYCAGFLRGLELVDTLLENPNYRSALLVASDQGGRGAIAESNRSPFCFIVGDSAGAVVIKKRRIAPWERQPRTGILDYLGNMVPSQDDLTAWGPDGVSMIVTPGAGVVALELLIDAGKRLLSRNGLTPRDVDWLLPAQTHAMTIEALCSGLNWPAEKVLWTGDMTGYAASASIPTCFAAHVHKGTIKKGQLVLSMAVGAGLNWAGALYYY